MLERMRYLFTYKVTSALDNIINVREARSMGTEGEGGTDGRTDGQTGRAAQGRRHLAAAAASAPASLLDQGAGKLPAVKEEEFE